MKRYVFDASLLLTSILGKKEKIAKKVTKLFSDTVNKKAEIYSSPLLFLEFANGLRFSLTDSHESILVYDKFSKLPIKIFSFNQNHLKEILNLSYQLNTTIYDTSYHFLAKLLSGTFLTCDRDYYKKAKQLEDITFLN